jgi:nicotinate-nucleotide pyrophosphorylase (carboxylating)
LSSLLEALAPRIEAALVEDLRGGDITSQALIRRRVVARAALIARQPGLICGLPLVPQILEISGSGALSAIVSSGATRRYRQGGARDKGPPTHLSWQPGVAEGARVERGKVLGELAAPLRTILAIERTMLNLLQRASGVATLTGQYVAAVAGTGAVIVDTRKTTPLWRDLDKYAVRVGGGRNHRMGLYDAVLIKDNHIDGGRLSLADAVRRARRRAPKAAFIEIEVRSLDQLRDVLPAEPDIVMPDNFPLPLLREAVAIVRQSKIQNPKSKILVEASGGITLDTVRAVAETGVDRIAVGALTHSAPALDIALDVVPE